MPRMNVHPARIAALSLSLALVIGSAPASPLQSLADGYRSDADRIIDAALSDHRAWERLALLTDTFGPRLSGSQSLEDAIDWVLEQMAADGLDNPHTEPVMVPHWVRGQESAELLEPRARDLPMLGLGGSVGTPDGRPWR